MNILVTGGAGFIGSNFVRYSAKCNKEYQSGTRIIVLDALTYAGNYENIKDLCDSGEVEFVHGSICDEKLVNGLIVSKAINLVINFAAETHVDRSIESPWPFFYTNVMGTLNLLEACRTYGVRFHQVSTDEVYGDLGRGSVDKFIEWTKIDPNCPYAASKASADLLVQSYHRTYGLHTTISRCTNNYGPYQFPEKLIPSFIVKALNNELLPLYGDGLNVRDWLYVEDHCRAIDMIAAKGEPGSIWNIGGSNEKTNLEITKMILKHLNKPESLIARVQDRQAHDERYAMDSTMIQVHLGWKPKHTFEEWLPKTIEWYLANHEWVKSCNSIIK